MFTTTQVAQLTTTIHATLVASVRTALVAEGYETVFHAEGLADTYKERFGSTFCASTFSDMVQDILEAIKEDRKNAYNYDDGGEWEAARLRESQEAEGLVLSELIDMPYEHWAESRGF